MSAAPVPDPVSLDRVEEGLNATSSSTSHAVGPEFPSCPVQQPSEQKANWNLTCFSQTPQGGRMSFSLAVILVCGPLWWFFTTSVVIVGASLAMAASILLGLPLCLLTVYFWTWWTESKGYSITDCCLPYRKQYAGIFLKLVYFFLNIGLPPVPQKISEVLRIEKLATKRKLKTATLQFGLNIRVPIGTEAQFAPVPSLVYEVMRQLWRYVHFGFVCAMAACYPPTPLILCFFCFLWFYTAGCP
jgi:hypothetical protein